MFSLCACATPAKPTPFVSLPSDTVAPSPIPTATIVWFPPTATFTPLPSSTPNPNPTQDQRAHHGDLILEDLFDRPDLWTHGKQNTGSIAFGKREISLGISEPQGYLVSWRAASILNDFYLEITASPSICRGGDEYGVIFRASSSADFFRFGLNCRGEARLDRVISGSASASQPPLKSGAIPPGAPSVSQLGIWALGKEMRFYANNAYLFTVRDPSILSGALGLYARAAGADEMSVNFSDLLIYEFSTVH
ncbi:MAG: hypothetical protein B6D39_09605 [Anaerolineae bacterium UTCFX2]|nr:MAG: hypothetical protein B6D39_09605 [Anaerolineae bacterium UTCFX2]